MKENIEILITELEILNEAQYEAQYTLNYRKDGEKLMIANRMFCELIANKIKEIKEEIQDIGENE